ncbi:sensor histidine kinase N-terminal domain-containing protein [Roseomonas sp. GC11]|uniref:sensor histidine kinase n=1 Tax=Roseomonas sp. GC11 TaxID=2950546 RepID=UPI00210C70CB|nr:sensor histidine kinase [Roseomonas sp. GC11]MCQ4161533.1 sensor histidine kinase N-terminal domain-containing protein [Roseomonas sp. GC11]
MTPIRSLHARVALLLVVMLGGVSACFSAAGWYYAQLTAAGAYDTLLRASAAQIAENTYLQGVMVTVEPPVSVLSVLSLTDRVVYKVVDPRGVVVAGSPALRTGVEEPAQRTLLRQRGWLLLDDQWQGEPVRVAVTTRQIGEGWAVIAVAQTLHGRTALARDIAGKAILAVLALNAIALIVTLLATKRVLAPLERVQASLRERDPRDLTPLRMEVPPEIAGLVGAINSFMARLDHRIGMMQRMIGDAAHQLRTPLAGLASQVDLLQVEQDPARRVSQLQRIATRTAELGRLVGQLFNHAMVTHRSEVVALEPVDVVELARRAMLDIAMNAPAWARSEPALAFDAPEHPVMVQGDAVSLREALLNLLNNALRHGAPTRLDLRILEQAEAVVVEVVDDGPGIPPALWARVREPFHQRPHGQPGAGLGLAIADAVLRAHGGMLQFRSDSRDGFAVLMTLPRRP